MAAAEEINKAIGAHGMWKQRLREAIDTGKSDFTVERVRPDNLCDFGKWLYSLPTTDQTSAHWRTVRELHGKFHIEAAHVLGLAVGGLKQEAEKKLDNASQFTKISSELTGAMMKWKASLAER
jgi:chemoreceptor zinc-binding protein